LRFVQNGVLECFLNLFDSSNPQIIIVALEGLNNLLYKGVAIPNEDGDNPFIIRLEESEGVQKIEDLQTHPNEDVYKKALQILDTHFVVENQWSNANVLIENLKGIELYNLSTQLINNS